MRHSLSLSHLKSVDSKHSKDSRSRKVRIQFPFTNDVTAHQVFDAPVETGNSWDAGKPHANGEEREKDSPGREGRARPILTKSRFDSSANEGSREEPEEQATRGVAPSPLPPAAGIHTRGGPRIKRASELITRE